MSSKLFVLLERAERDIEDAADHYVVTGGIELALRFAAALEAAFAYLGKHPDAGSPRYSVELDLPGLRHWQLRDFPFLVFYRTQDSHIDVWRVLHAQRDMPARLQDDDDGAA